MTQESVRELLRRRTEAEATAYIEGFQAGVDAAFMKVLVKLETILVGGAEELEKSIALMKGVNEDLKDKGMFNKETNGEYGGPSE